MLTVSKKKDSVSGEEFSCVRLTENQLHQLAMLKRGQSLFDCVVMHAGYEGNYHGPVRNSQRFFLIFSYQGICYGTGRAIKVGELPWQRQSDTEWEDVEEIVDGIRKRAPGSIQYEAYPEIYLVRFYA